MSVAPMIRLTSWCVKGGVNEIARQKYVWIKVKVGAYTIDARGCSIQYCLILPFESVVCKEALTQETGQE